MTLSAALVELVRLRASCACEYGGVTEVDSAGRLTIDHIRPQSRGGTDDPDNLAYCCFRCNNHKRDFWPESADGPLLWHPRHGPVSAHVMELTDGLLLPLTPTGEITVRVLRLNRPPLVGYRLRRRTLEEQARLLVQEREARHTLLHLYRDLAEILTEFRSVIRDQQTLLELLHKRESDAS